MAVLYRKYRPQAFSEVVSQQHIVKALRSQVSKGQPAHAYLFTGSRGVGKTSVARIFAKAVNCSRPKDGEPCLKCEPCSQIAQNNFLDLVEIDAASHTGIDNIRDLIEHIKFSPGIGKYKVFIIDEVHMLSKGAFNALLKTLEEPPSHAIFILATTEINKVPSTIISRTQRFDFKRLSLADMEDHLQKVAKAEKLKIPKAALGLVAQQSEGSVRDALTLLDKIATLGQDATLEDCRQLLGVTDISLCEELLGYILSGNSAAIPPFFSAQLERGADFTVLNRDFLEYLRVILVYKAAGQGLEESLEGEHKLKAEELSKQASVMDIIFIVRLFLKSYKDLSYAPWAQVPLMLAALEGAMRKNQPEDAAKKPAPPGSLRPQQEATLLSGAGPAGHSESGGQPEEASELMAVSAEEVSRAWPRFIAELKDANGPLAQVVKAASICDVSGTCVTLGVKFEFHRQNLENKKNQEVLRGMLEKATGKKLSVKARIIKDEQAERPDAAAESLSDALKIFGGEVLE